MLRAPCLAMTLLVLSVGPAAAGAPGPGANAALKYWQAFATLPPLTDAEQKKLYAECVTMPLDAFARKTASRSEYALRMLHRGAALRRCDWGIGYEEEGVGLLLPQGSAARVLSSVACLRARLEFEEGRDAEGVADLVAAMTLARHSSEDGINIMVLIGHGIEQRAGETLALYLPRLKAGMVRDLKMRLDALPPGGSPTTAVKFEEKSALEWLVRKVKSAKDKESLVAVLAEFGEPPAKARAVLEACGGTAAGVLRYAAQTRRTYGRMAKKLGLPLDEFQKEWEREQREQAGNPLFPLVIPAYGKMRWLQARAEVRRALLSAALAVRLEGRAALKEHPDPVAGGPFEYVGFEGGFELRSTWKPDAKLRAKLKLDKRFDEPLTLTVGRRGK
jgi:hypothetical protein